MKTTIIVLSVGVLVLGLCALFAYTIQAVRDDEIARAYRETEVSPTDAARPAESPAQPAVRASEPALRVYTCGNCTKGRVYRPKDWCEDCVQEFLTSTTSGGAA